MNAFAGTGALVRLVLRRDRIRLAVWIIALVGITAASAAGVAATYDTPAEIASYQRNVGSSPAGIAMAGPPVGLDRIQGIVVYETSLTVLLGVAIMTAMTVVRHTRAEEELGRTELLASGVVGRHAGTAAAVLVAAAAAVLGLAFALRAIGDVQESGLVWLSPIGWSQQVRLFEADRWWPLLVSLIFALLLLGGAGWLTTRRDVGAGVLPDRRGPAYAGRGLSSPLGLAWRLQRGTVVAWGIGLALLGLVFGSFGEELENMVADNPTLQEYFAQTGGSVTDAFYATALLFMGLGAAGFAVGSALRLHSEEGAGRVEPILATAVSRWRMLLTPLVVTLGGAALLVTLGGVGVAVADAAVRGSSDQLLRLVALSWVQLPAVLVLVGLAVLLLGWAQRASAVAWAALGFAVVIGWLGGLLRLPDWVDGLSPFQHLPQVPVEDVAVAPLLVLTLIGLGLIAVGAVGYRRRDIG